ncbi:unnamed protein product [marine sediment metagenome]|uniref:Carboxypeptidase regulatory-like domain-containing protein n=1 Tax=marine sediment metagenome TaxID=412755 RepID=X1ENG6_9ZZZZ
MPKAFLQSVVIIGEGREILIPLSIENLWKTYEVSIVDLSGVVTDNEGSPIQDVVVTLDSWQVLTSAYGGYSFDNMLIGDYIITFSKTGYDSYSAAITLTIGDNTLDTVLFSPPSIIESMVTLMIVVMMMGMMMGVMTKTTK